MIIRNNIIVYSINTCYSLSFYASMLSFSFVHLARIFYVHLYARRRRREGRAFYVLFLLLSFCFSVHWYPFLYKALCAHIINVERKLRAHLHHHPLLIFLQLRKYRFSTCTYVQGKYLQGISSSSISALAFSNGDLLY